jgi:tetratricopeptide (TPR) repeat protein
MDMSDEATKARCSVWSTAFEQACREHYDAKGLSDIATSADTTLDAEDKDPENAIELYSAVINLGLASNTVFVKRSKAKSEQRLWEDALLDAQKVVQQSPSSYIGYQAKHAVLHAAQRYDEAIEAFQAMLLKLDTSPDTRKLRQQYVSQFDAERVIQKVIHDHMENTPTRLLDTSTGRLYDKEAQTNAFKASTEYKELLSSSTKHADLQTERIQKVVARYFGYVMLSHTWEGKEPLLHDIQGKSVYELNPVDGIRKLQRFCETARDGGYRWAWSDTCCINKKDIGELPASITSMFRWYQHSALTIVYLSDISLSLGSGALTKSAWITRGWTLQEFLAPNVILFYRNDWTPYLDHHSDNHKEFIMQELKDVTGIDSRFYVTFFPGMRDPREKLKWASKRVTKELEDVAYSLFGIFTVYLPVIYGEGKQNAVGRLLEKIVARSRDVSVLDWVGKSSEYNSCLPADLTPYGDPSLPCLSKDEIQASISSLQFAGTEGAALELYNKLNGTSPPGFSNGRLRLPCIVFHVTKVKRRGDQDQEMYFTYDMEAKGLCDLLITTEKKLFSRAKSQKFLLVRPLDRRLLELHDFSDDTESMDESMDDLSPPSSPSDSHGGFAGEQESLDSELSERALRLIARLKQPFRAFLLAQKYGEEYTRIMSDRDIIAQVKDTTSIRDMMDCVRTVEVV